MDLNLAGVLLKTSSTLTTRALKGVPLPWPCSAGEQVDQQVRVCLTRSPRYMPLLH